MFRMLDLVAHGADGHDLVHLLLVSAAEIGFCLTRGEERGWIRAALLPLGMPSGPIQHFQSAIVEAGQLKVSAPLADGKGFQGAQSGCPRLFTTAYHSRRNQFERFRGVLELTSRVEFEFRRCENYFF